MSRLLALVALLGLYFGPAYGDVANQCNHISHQWVCEGKRPVLRLHNDVNGPSQTYISVIPSDIGAQISPPSPPKSIRLSGANSAQSIAFPTGTKFPATVAFSGLPFDHEPDGPCCFSTRLISSPPDNICPPDLPDAYDISVDIRLPKSCPYKGGKNTCTGSVTIANTSDTNLDDAIIPFTISSNNPRLTSLKIQNYDNCDRLGPNAMFCQIPATDIPASGLTFDVAITTTPANTAHDLRACAALDLPPRNRQKIRLIQSALNGIGYDVGATDGIIGAQTITAIKQFRDAYGLATNDPLDPVFLATFGLAPFRDRVLENNRACAVTTLSPAPKSAPKPRPRAPRATTLKCDPRTTKAKSGACQCRYKNMHRVNSARCACRAGAVAVNGIGCVKIGVSIDDDVDSVAKPCITIAGAKLCK